MSVELKINIQSALKSFGNGSLTVNSLNLFAALGYNTTRQNPFVKKTTAEFEDNFGHAFAEKNFNKEKARFDEWQSVDLLFQLSREELSGQQGLFDSHKINWEGEDEKTVIETYLFFAIELTQPEYSRTLLAQITREVNKIFSMPVMIIFRHGQTLTLSIIDRRLHKRDAQKDVLKKVTLIKDISIESPHRAHIEILFDLSLEELRRVYKFTNFVELHNAWRKTLDTKELNKRFYSELSNWYFWAMDHVSFPDDVEKNKDIRNATSLIRLITRIIFIWFIKEKDLVPDVLFDCGELQRILKAFDKNKKSNSYYRAILQNLFFGTLNQRMNERGFAREGSFQENRNNYGVKNLFRYAGDFAIDEKEALALFKDIPFLNGGLFDCLDKENDEDKVIYSDGFSRNPKKQAIVPDFLFFGAEDGYDYDLNAIYGTRNKRYKVKSLFNILSAYKFTVAENTPVEEEIALDPELLGRVFENLLASYNPETQTTARKQTGSFYTPREIVNYMVDESLKAYLKQKLETDMKPEDADAGLEILFSYTEKEHAFTGRETKTLIAAIDDCKILDPACGSGAFPMGVLHKLVHILHKLDPHNEKWQERQIAKARQIDDPAIREQSIVDIEAAFTNNELDYGRKLYLIENCIYGVDIQPIAVQIAKLRFFISLVVDQKKQLAKKNLGILSLPNLETKFVAANTLIGLDKPQTGGQVSIKNPEIENLENDLKALRHQYFNARTRKEKLICQKKDKDLRSKISALLIKDGWDTASARQVAAFDPYDQNASSPFFDQEWMFGIMDRFDVVIGNPPYVDSESMVKHFPNLRESLSLTYKTTKGNWDLYIAFYEKAYNLLKANGFASFITPNKWLSAPYGKELRNYFNKTSLSLVNCSKIKVFEAGNTPIIFSFGGLNKTINVFEYDENWQMHLIDRINKKNLKTDNWGLLLSSNLKTIRKLESFPGRVKNMCSVENPFSTAEAYVLTEIVDDNANAQNAFKLITTGAIDPFETLWGINTTSYLKSKYIFPIVSKSKLKKTLPRRFEQQNCPKIAISGMRYFEAFYDICGNYLSSKSTIIAKDFEDSNVGYFLLGIFNSLLTSFYLKESYSSSGIDGGINFSKEMVEEIPLPTTQPIKAISDVSRILLLIKSLKADEIYFNFFKKLLNAMVSDLYFPDEIKAADAEVIKHLTNTSTTFGAGLPELKDAWTDEKKLAVIEKVYQELSDPKHPVTIATARQKTIPEVRIIEGLDK